MIQAIDKSRQTQTLSATQTATLARPITSLTASEAVSATSLQPDQLSIAGMKGKSFSEAEVRAALDALTQKYGSLRKPGFFKNPKIDINEAVDRLNNGKDVIAYNKDLNDKHDTFDSHEELMLLDDLQGRKGDHGVSKPELRLPLIFLEKQKLEAYNSNDNERLDAYAAYSDLKRGWRIVINNKTVKPEELAGHVIRSGWTETQDPGQKVRTQFSRLPEAGWQLNGQNVSRDLAYLAFITGDTRLNLDGVAIGNQKDFDLALNLIANEPNNAIDSGLRERLTHLKLDSFSSPVSNFYSVYKYLENSQALRYDGSTLNNLDEMVIYDALAGSRKPTELLAPKHQAALQYLSQDAGLSSANAFQAWQSLKAGETVSYSFKGGPTGENISFRASSLDQAVQMQTQVVTQRQRDQFRPDLNQAKQIISDRLPGLSSGVSQNLERTRTAVARAQKDIPIQESKRSAAQQDYNRIKPEYDQALNKYQRAEDQANRAQRSYESDKRSYDWEMDKYQRYEREYSTAQNHYDRAQSQARSYENQARKEDGLVSSDPKNAAAHRQNAANYRTKAQASLSDANRYRRDMDSARRNMDSQRWNVDRARREMDASQRQYWDARSNMESAKGDWQYQQRDLNDASNRLRQAENQLRVAQQTVADGGQIESVSAKISTQVELLNKTMSRLGSYADYGTQRQTLHNAAAELQRQFGDSVYARVHGESLLKAFAPLQTLLNNMDKSAS